MEKESNREPENDSQLTGRLTEGDLESYRILFYRYYPTVLAFVRGMIKDLWTSEDIAQNIFMKVWLNREKLNKDQSIKNYLFVLAKHEVYNHFRSKQSKMVLLGELISDTRATSVDTEQQLNATQLSENVDRAIAHMPQQRQRVFRMSRQEYLSNGEIATRLGLSVKTVDKHIELALRELRKIVVTLLVVLAPLIK